MSVLSICNILMAALEDEPLQALEDSKAGKHCDANFDFALNATLALRHWNVNEEVTSLTALAEKPVDYDYQYPIPEDLLNLRAMLDPISFKPVRVPRVIRKRLLLTNAAPPVHIKFGTRLTRDDLDNPLSAVYPLDPLLEECIAYRLGTIIAKTITGEQGDMDMMINRFRESMLDAGAVDASNEIEQKMHDYDDWVDVNRAIDECR